MNSGTSSGYRDRVVHGKNNRYGYRPNGSGNSTYVMGDAPYSNVAPQHRYTRRNGRNGGRVHGTTSQNPQSYSIQHWLAEMRKIFDRFWYAPSQLETYERGIKEFYRKKRDDISREYKRESEKLRRQLEEGRISKSEFQKQIMGLKRDTNRKRAILETELYKANVKLDLRSRIGEVSTRRISLAARAMRSVDAALNAANKLLAVYGAFQSIKGVVDSVRGADVASAQQQLGYAQQQAQTLPTPQQLYEAARDGELSEESLQQLMERIEEIEATLSQITPTLEAISATMNVNSQYSNATQTATQPTPTQPSEPTATSGQAENSTYQKPENNTNQKATQATAVAVIAALALSLFLFTSRSTMMAAAAIPKTPLVIGLSLILVISIGALLRIKR